jgi:hypothetical protein
MSSDIKSPTSGVKRTVLKEITLMHISYQRHRKPIWFYAREIDYGGDFLDKATYGEMYGAKERHAYDLH